MNKYIGIDQYGHVYHLGEHPRKELIKQIGISHVEKMYMDDNIGTKHVGYIIGGLWITLYTITEYGKRV